MAAQFDSTKDLEHYFLTIFSKMAVVYQRVQITLTLQTIVIWEKDQIPLADTVTKFDKTRIENGDYSTVDRTNITVIRNRNMQLFTKWVLPEVDLAVFFLFLSSVICCPSLSSVCGLSVHLS